MGEQIVVFITASSEEEAGRIASALVNERLAACANIVPGVRSVFFWDGKAQDAREALLVVKSRMPVFASLLGRVKTLHSYTVPEVIAMPIIAGAPEYLTWIDESTSLS